MRTMTAALTATWWRARTVSCPWARAVVQLGVWTAVAGHSGGCRRCCLRCPSQEAVYKLLQRRHVPLLHQLVVQREVQEVLEAGVEVRQLAQVMHLQGKGEKVRGTSDSVYRRRTRLLHLAVWLLEMRLVQEEPRARVERELVTAILSL